MTHRPRSLDEIDALPGLRSEEGVKRAKAFQPRPTDVFIAPYGKSGTTWLQQMAHSLRSRGDMNFREITEVTPWIEMAYDIGWDVEAEQAYHPRLFKSHLPWGEIQKGGRYIVSIRDPRDVAVSSYRFFEGWWFEPGTIPIEAYTRARFLNRDRPNHYWSHLKSWWRQRENPAVLLLCYEEMKTNLPGTVRRVAAHMGIELDDELFEIAVHHASLDFMKAHKSHFDDHYMRELSERKAGLPPGSDSSKVRKGRAGEHAHELPPAVIEEIDRAWAEEITPELGLANYTELQSALAD